jgi:hypothetical protein
MRSHSNPDGSTRNRSRPSSIVNNNEDNLDEMLGRVRNLRETRKQILKDMAMMKDAFNDTESQESHQSKLSQISPSNIHYTLTLFGKEGVTFISFMFIELFMGSWRGIPIIMPCPHSWHQEYEPNGRPIFSLKSRTFGLGQTNWAYQFWGIWDIFSQTISTHFGKVSPLSIFSIIQSLFLQKTKPLCPHSKYLFGIGI